MRKIMKSAVFLLALFPFVHLLIRALTNDLGPDPAKELSIETGEWALRFLLITLSLTPLRQLTGKTGFILHRRMLGLFALFYASIHLLVWMTFILDFRWIAIVEEILDRPYITVGFTAYVILVALGITSTNTMMRKMGKNWKRLHRLVYIAAILAIVHLLWILRADIAEAVLYGSLVFLLLGYRYVRSLRSKKYF
tara:strand:- start:101 stop:685 length:585 start_codon:yes stop_codon:yes gene_type:complete